MVEQGQTCKAPSFIYFCYKTVTQNSTNDNKKQLANEGNATRLKSILVLQSYTEFWAIRILDMLNICNRCKMKKVSNLFTFSLFSS